MSNLYIQVENNVPVNHPAYESNLIEAFGEVPTNWIPFVRVAYPELGTYEVLSQPVPTYEAGGDVFTDRWHIRDMDTVERLAKDKAIADAEELLTGVTTP